MTVKEVDTFVKLKNPYTFGVPVRGEGKFFGREEELQRIFDTLENVPRGQKQDMVVLGPRRIGKSSLLYRLVDLLKSNEDFIPIYIDVQSIKPRKVYPLFHKILNEIKSVYQQRNLSTTLPPFNILESTRIPTDLEFFTFDEDMSRLNNVIATQNLPRLVLIFDEVELLIDFGGQDTLGWFRSLIQSMLYTIFVVAGSEGLYALTQDYGSPFYNIFKTVEIRPLTSEAARKLIEVPANAIGLQIASSDVNEILSYTGNSPYFIQGICHYLVEELNQQHRYKAYAEDINIVLDQSLDYLSAQFAYIWGGTSQIQKTILYILAEKMSPQTIDALIMNSPLLENSIQNKQEEQDIFANLVEQQILQTIEDTYYSFTIPLFANWILSKVGDEEITQAVQIVPDVISNVDIASFKKDLNRLFDSIELDEFVLFYFPRVFERFSPNMRKDRKITLLLDYIWRFDQFNKLSKLIEEQKAQRSPFIASQSTKATVFISYSYKDEAEKNKLLSHLGVIKQADLIDIWSDDRIGPGADWAAEMNRAISQAKIAILLITANFLTSDSIMNQQIPMLLKRSKQEGVIILPLIVTPSAWQSVAWLNRFAVRPTHGKAIWREGGRYADKDLTDIVKEIADILQEV